MDPDFSEHRVPRDGLGVAPAQAALLVVDMLNDFLEEGGAMVLASGRSLYRPIAQLLAAARQAGVRVFWICDRHPDLEDREFEKRTPHCLEGTWGAGIVIDLEQRPEDQVVTKRRYSGFFQTDLDLRLRELELRQLIVTGVVTNICVRSTVHDAFFRGYDVIVPEDCVAATSEREQASSLHDIDTHYGTVCSLSDVLDELSDSPAALGDRAR